MTIGIEAQRLFRKKKHGMDMVALELIRNLQEIDVENEYIVFVKPDEDREVIKPSENLRVIELEGGSYPVWEQYALPKAAEKYRCRILHCTSNTAPVFTSLPLVVTLHDIIYMEKSYLGILQGSGTSYQKFGNIYRRMVVPRVVSRSKRIITVSHFEKNRIAGFFGLKDNHRLRAVYNGVGAHFRQITEESERIRVKNKYRLPDHYFFFLGNTDPKKNTRGTLKAFSDFVRQTGSDVSLVMLDYDRPELMKLLESIGDPELINRIVLTGYVVNTDLPAIYSQASLFLYPSLRESFGIPILEAMACGVPVVTSNTSSMPEVAGDAAWLADPSDPATITNGIISITSDPSLRDSLIQKGLDRAAMFTWRAMAREVLQIYQELM
jgi:glycosyltransferase involved in cell wall biosynthesis